MVKSKYHYLFTTFFVSPLWNWTWLFLYYISVITKRYCIWCRDFTVVYQYYSAYISCLKTKNFFEIFFCYILQIWWELHFWTVHNLCWIICIYKKNNSRLQRSKFNFFGVGEKQILNLLINYRFNRRTVNILYL